MNKLPLFVCGFGRCGSSLAMQMLEAGGYPVLGEYPAYEPEIANLDRKPLQLISAAQGKAVKVLDPHLTTWPETEFAKIIFMSRERKQQALSQLKFMRMVGGIDVPNSHASSLALSYLKSMEVVVRDFAGLSILNLTFEYLLAMPMDAASKINDFCGGGLKLMRMARTVIPRRSECQPGMDIELNLVGLKG